MQYRTDTSGPKEDELGQGWGRSVLKIAETPKTFTPHTSQLCQKLIKLYNLTTVQIQATQDSPNRVEVSNTKVHETKLIYYNMTYAYFIKLIQKLLKIII